jgi:hypothetical protein
MAAEDPTPKSWSELSRAEKRRLRLEAIERRERRLADRDASLETQLEPGEIVVARSGDHPLVTDRRILMARQRCHQPRRGEWVWSSLAFAEIARWTPGRQHDHRPLLRLEHPPCVRVECVPEHRFLGFEWGNAEGPVTQTTTTLGFGRDTDPVLVAIREGLERAKVPRGEPFVARPAGTREERTQGSSRMLTASFARGSPRRSRARLGLREAADRLYHGRLSWRVRIPSWVLLAVPAWFIEPWLVVPAIALAEVAWIIGLQWAWRRGRDRRGG